MKTAKGTITEDPAINLPIGSGIRFNPVTINHEFKQSAVWLRNWTSFKGILLSVHLRNKNEHSVEGSAVMVAPGIALGAKHVFEPHLKEIENGTTATGP